MDEGAGSKGSAARGGEDAGPGGGSALGQAVLTGMEIGRVECQIRMLTDQLRHLRRSRRAWEIGARGEQAVVRVLVGMDDAGWHVLADRRWPGTRRANIDILLVGPGGVFVIDVKTWRDVSVENGRLWRGDIDASDHVSNLLAQTEAVEEVLVEEGLAPAEVVPLLVLAGRRNSWAQLGRVQVLGERDLNISLLRRGLRLTPEIVETLAQALDRGCPPMPGLAHRGPVARTERRRSPRSVDPAPQHPLLSVEQVWQGVIEAAEREPIEPWMAFLHPSQSKMVNRRWSGPARIRGAAGTGKSVVALHRARYLAARGDRVLFTSYLRTLVPINRAVLTRMAPHHAKNVEFSTVHAVAMRYLRKHGLPHRYDEAAAKTCFWLAWGRLGRSSPLAALGVRPEYWREEISTVIKGRGLTGFEQYLSLARMGRRTPLQGTRRHAVWDLYLEYEKLRAERGILDADDVLLTARDLVRAEKLNEYDAVIVDEVQDLTSVGLQFLYALVGDKPDGLLLVGDGQQQVYPGGCTLAEAGIPIVGRSVVLDRNYRNREVILQYALAVVANDEYSDLDSDPQLGRREVLAEREGGRIIEALVADESSQEMALCTHLLELNSDHGVRFGDMAVLVSSNAAAKAWCRALLTEEVPAILLTDYDGTPIDAVKVGTFHRAKGIDFFHVSIPDRDRFPPPRRHGESVEAHRERAELERRQLYVAITRARDSLWLGYRDSHPG